MSEIRQTNHNRVAGDMHSMTGDHSNMTIGGRRDDDESPIHKIATQLEQASIALPDTRRAVVTDCARALKSDDRETLRRVLPQARNVLSAARSPLAPKLDGLAAFYGIE